MSGRNRGRKTPHTKTRGRGRARAGARPAHHAAACPLAPPQCPRLHQDTPAAQVQAGAGVGGLETSTPATPLGPGEEGACRLPLDCGLEPLAEGGGQVVRPSKAAALMERLGRDTPIVRTVGGVARPRSGPRGANRRGVVRKKGPGTGGAAAAGRGSQVNAVGKVKKERERAAVSAGEAKKEERSAGPGPEAIAASEDSLQVVQLKLDSMNAQADRSYLRLARKFGRLRLQHMERRNRLIQGIPGFWARVLQNHPQLSAFLSSQDKELLTYLNNLEVEELGLARLGYRIRFYFGLNPYFQNRMLMKEYGCGASGQVVSRSTPIQWLPGHDLQALTQRHGRSFLGWFSNHIAIQSDKIVAIINEELWPNPLQYYRMDEGAGEEKGKQVRQDPAKQQVESVCLQHDQYNHKSCYIKPIDLLAVVCMLYMFGIFPVAAHKISAH
ncbi:PREDICTED: testis-specific Y-encoded-like protein 5 [Elephantulus edwardii]|uniref:testis-specific Y-encoded-like protein 5 n=1 Tax=Elephantulus edwardii TaxID=28737 RepID=UPI0003F0E6F3|nr:PREDICTED: testis-specific Y-encoded-like protein 5 [Elephantulus edwardii]